MQITTAIRLLVFSFLLCCSSGIMAAITIDSVRVQKSNCANDGVINVYAQSPSSMIYAIIGGPDIRPPQSGSQFAALPAGTYQIRITNFSNDTALTSAVVTGNYSFPDFTPTYTHPKCAGTPTGVIRGNANAGGGKPPYTWHVTNTATNNTVVYTKDSFPNLPAGTYTIRQYDSCQNFATRSITLIDPVHSMAFSNINNRVIACDTVELYIQLNISTGVYAFPYTLEVQTPNGTFQYPILNWTSGGNYPDFTQKVAGIGYGDYCHITITDGCGNSIYRANRVSPFNITGINFGGSTDSCQARFMGYFNVSYPQDPNVRITEMAAPVTVILSDPVTGVVIDSLVNDGYNRNSAYIAFSTYQEGGKQYRATVKDACGNVFTNIYQWPNVPASSFMSFPTNTFCRDSTIGYNMRWMNQFYSIPKFELLSGPSSIHSTKPHYEYRDTIIYPQEIPVSPGGNDGQGNFSHYIEITNLGVGTYTYRITDSCGTSLSGTFTITPQMVGDLRYTYSYQRGCPGENKLHFWRNYGNASNAYFMIEGGGGNPVFNYRDRDSLINLNAATYALAINYYWQSFSTPINAGGACNIVRDTAIIPPYDLPKIDYATQVKCNGTVNVGLQPDSSKGLAPYAYEIVSGPQTASVQASNFFTLTQPGNYTARISDVCGFARTFTFAVDTLEFPDIVKIGSSCIGNSVTLIAQHSPYATHRWRKPNGASYTGDTLVINPITGTDYGTYNIMRIVVVNNCRDTFYTTYTLSSGSTGILRDTICAGDTIHFNGMALTQTGVYYDTISATPCDSVVAFNLYVTPAPYDSLVRNVCTGQSVAIGSKIYNTTGIYRDTLTTVTGCDSIVVLNLTVNSFKQDSIVRSVCLGQTVTVGSNTYNATGIYRDTLSTATCDSIVILNLTVSNFKRDSVVQTICFGQSITVGSNIYSNTGVYRDTFSTATCDSIHILNLTVENQKRDSVNLAICSGQSVTVGNRTYNTTGLYRDTLSTTTCDSIHILNLIVSDYKKDSSAVILCEGGSITVGLHTYTTTGVYYDTLATAGCDSIIVLNLQVLPALSITITRSICSGQSVAIGSNVYSNTGTYTDTLTSVAGCDSIITLNLSITDAIRDTVRASFCEGESVVVDGVIYTQPASFADTFTTTACDSIRTVVVTMYAKPIIKLTPDRDTIAGGKVTEFVVVAYSNYNYIWESTTGVDVISTSGASALVTASDAGWVIVQATNNKGCSAIDSAFVNVAVCDEAVFVPNMFSPNGDEYNDKFKVYGNCIILSKAQVFNRWGEKMWETQNIEEAWDGYYKGELQPTGVYVYVVRYVSASTEGKAAETLKGSVTLVR